MTPASSLIFRAFPPPCVGFSPCSAALTTLKQNAPVSSSSPEGIFLPCFSHFPSSFCSNDSASTSSIDELRVVIFCHFVELEVVLCNFSVFWRKWRFTNVWSWLFFYCTVLQLWGNMQLCSLVHFINFHFCKTIFRIVFEYCFLNTSIQKFFKENKERKKKSIVWPVWSSLVISWSHWSWIL